MAKKNKMKIPKSKKLDVNEETITTEHNMTDISNYKINIALCGQVSSGKSTAINAILGKYLSETSMKRTTKKVYTFVHSNNKNDYSKNIKHDIIELNNNGENNKEFIVHIPFTNKKSLLCAIKDYPGFNDGKEDIAGMENLFYNDLPEIDYILYILDATCPLIHKSEKELITNIFGKIKNNQINNKYTRIAFIFNKVDDDEDEEILGLVVDATSWLKEKMNESQIEIINDWFLSVSFRKMMVYSINKYGSIQDIPEIVIKRILTEMYGKNMAKNMLKNTKLEINDLTKDENGLFDMLKMFIDKEFNNKHISKNFLTQLNSIDMHNYDLICKCIHKHQYLRELSYNGYVNGVISYLEIMNKFEFYDKYIIAKHLDVIIALYMEYIAQNKKQTDTFIKNIYNKFVIQCDYCDELYSYIISILIEYEVEDWLSLDIEYFNSFYDNDYPVEGFYNIIIDHGNIQFIPKSKIFNLDIENIKKLTNYNKHDMITKFINCIDILICEKLFVDIIKTNNQTYGVTRGYFPISSEYNKEKQYSTCARMEKNWIDYKGVDCGIRVEPYKDMEEYHKWSIQYVEYPNEINKSNIGLYPQHVMNFIILNTLLITSSESSKSIQYMDNDGDESEYETYSDNDNYSTD
jgi:GTPase Era involved in 16S rRNA processing